MSKWLVEDEKRQTVIVAVFRRRLREGKTFEDLKRAWEADKGFGVPARVNRLARESVERFAQVIGQPVLVRLKTISPTSRETTIAT